MRERSDTPVGSMFGLWRVVGPARPEWRFSHRYIEAVCTGCGVSKSLDVHNLRSGKSRACRSCSKTGGGTLAERIAAGSIPEPNSGCWLWLGKTADYGYGVISVDGRSEYAHRASLQAKLGRALRRGEWALHHCDNPPCVNQDHLWPGTHSDNMRDMVAKLRHPRTVKRLARGFTPSLFHDAPKPAEQLPLGEVDTGRE